MGTRGESAAGNALEAARRLEAAGDFEGVVAVLRRVVEIAPLNAEAHGRLGIALRELGRLEEAIDSFDAAAESHPGLASAHSQAALTFEALGRFDEAIARYRRSLELQPEQPEVRWNLALALLLIGRLKEGWELFESRWQTRVFAGKRPSLAAPVWQGEELRGKTLLVLPEQGFGDNIQFARYVPLAAARGARVVVATKAQLMRLFASLGGAAEVRSNELPLPPCDYWTPVMSLPRLFDTTLASIPTHTPYLRAPAGAVQAWRKRIGTRPALKVGIVWSGGILVTRPDLFSSGASKSLPPAVLAPFAAVRGVRFYSLQKLAGPRADVASLKALRLVDWTSELSDFADTAALIEALDLVVTVDTSVAHLTGALGKPVWTLLKVGADWRWLLDCDRSPWYPSMRLFRQQTPGDWRPAVAAATAALQALADERGFSHRGLLDRLLGRG